MTTRIPLAKPQITDFDREAVLDVLRTSHLSSGPKVEEFERAMCDYTGAKHAVAVNSGTSALLLAIRALKLDPGSEVILPSFTFSALLNVILQEGLRPRFVDIDPVTYNTTPELVEAAVTQRTRLIIAVHTFGIPVEVDEIACVAKQGGRGRPPHTIHVIEDACEALGADIHGRQAGTLGEAGLFAFYPNKQITTGEGGMLVTSDDDIAREARMLRNQGRDPALDWYQHAEVGFSYRISDVNCALGSSQLQRLDSIVVGRQKLAETYHRELGDVQGVLRPPPASAVGQISWFVYAVRLAEEFTRADRDGICQAMLRKGIATGRYFAPLHKQPVFTSHPLAQVPDMCGRNNLANTEAVADRVIALPFFNELTLAEIQEVCGALDESIREARRKT